VRPVISSLASWFTYCPRRCPDFGTVRWNCDLLPGAVSSAVSALLPGNAGLVLEPSLLWTGGCSRALYQRLECHVARRCSRTREGGRRHWAGKLQLDEDSHTLPFERLPSSSRRSRFRSIGVGYLQVRVGRPACDHVPHVKVKSEVKRKACHDDSSRCTDILLTNESGFSPHLVCHSSPCPEKDAVEKLRAPCQRSQLSAEAERKACRCGQSRDTVQYDWGGRRG
jgi:hypothetical protein